MKPEHQAISFFFPDQEIRDLTPIGSGNVNETWKVRFSSGRCTILQKLSPAVFPDPDLVMTNLKRVTDHLQQELKKKNDTFIKVPQLLYSPGGEANFLDHQGNYWRMLSYIHDSRTLTVLDSPTQAREIGWLLGCFHQMLSTLNPAMLHNPLPGFHVTAEYLNAYDAISQQQSQPVDSREQWCTGQIEHFRDRTDVLECQREELRTGIIHGDPKVANFLFSRESNTVISLIDLDTVMPGLLLHDLGDCLRSCCNPAGEEIADPRKISFDEERFTAVLSGYCSQVPGLLAPKDQELLIDAAWLISFELGLRFFTDHLAGNQYFKVRRPNQNLHRALVQFHLAQSILKQRSRLDLLWQRIMMTQKNSTSSF